jgi:hypothetical protein
MANAKPVKLRAPAGGSNTAAAAAATKGPRVSVAPAAGALGGDGAVAQAAAALARPYTNLPDRLNVKIFFSQASGGNFVCSGTIANSTTKRMVSTAGHCVSNGAGQFHRNVVVVPGYSSRCDGCGDAPYGRWTARELTTLTEWHSFSNFKQDVAYIIVNDRNGQRIVNRLGGQGSRFNVSRSQQFRSYGYPQAAPFNGFNQYVCPPTRATDDPHLVQHDRRLQWWRLAHRRVGWTRVHQQRQLVQVRERAEGQREPHVRAVLRERGT